MRNRRKRTERWKGVGGGGAQRQSWIHKITPSPLAHTPLFPTHFSAHLSYFSGLQRWQRRGAVCFWNKNFSLTVNRIRGRTPNTPHLGLVHLLWYAKGCLIIARQCFSQGPRGCFCVVCVGVCVCVGVGLHVGKREILGSVPRRHTSVPV